MAANMLLLLQICTLNEKLTGYALTELQLNKANSSGSAVFVFEFIHIKYYIFQQKYDKRVDFDFNIVNFPFLDGNVLRRTSCDLYVFLDISSTRIEQLYVLCTAPKS